MSSRFGIPARCMICHPRNFGVSRAEKDFVEFLKGFGFSLLEHDRSVIGPYELDAYIPEKKLAFEFNGMFWHSEQAGKDRNYHLEKTRLCGEKGIRLVHVFEDEWRDGRAIAESRIKDMLGVHENTVFARKCSI